MNEKEEYQKLTGVNIDDQKEIWDERGKGYYGEYLVFCELLNRLDGKCKILMNLNIPAKGKTTEIDLMLMHETGIYVFEVKHYKGTIYGSEGNRIWTQYFRTSENQKFNNPIMQNNYHINSLKALFPDEHFESVIVFTNEEVTLKLNNLSGEYLITTLSDMINDVEHLFKDKEAKYSGDRIDELFKKLRGYSSFDEKAIEFNDDIIPFYDYIDSIRDNVNENTKHIKQKINDLDSAIGKSKKESKRNKIIFISVMISSVLLAIFVCVSVYKSMVSSFEQTKADYEKTYLRIDEIDDASINMAKDIVKVDDIKLVKSKDFKNAVDLNCSLKNISDNYNIRLNETSALIVMLENNMTYEYPIFNDDEPYRTFSSNIGNEDSLYSHSYEIKKVLSKIEKVDDISYIKITDMTIWEFNDSGLDVTVADDVDVELYNKK